VHDETLHNIADGDLSSIRSLAHDVERTRAIAGLEDEAVQVAEIVALASVDAPPVSWFHYFMAHETSLGTEKMIGILGAVMPIIGAPRVVAAAANIIGATDFVEELEEDAP